MSAPVDPEFLLAAACCRWPPSPLRDAAVRAAAIDVDWPRYGQVVRRQRIAGLVDAALADAKIDCPAAVAAPISHEARKILFRNMTAAVETARLIALITERGYPALAIKGVVLSALAYGSIALKHSKDIDLLVTPDDALAVIALLEEDGYRLTYPAPDLSTAQRRTLTTYGKDVALTKPGGALQLELHWRLFDSEAVLPEITARAPAQSIPLGGGRSAPTLAQPALYAYLVLHGATDGWSRLKWLADLNALLAPLDSAAVAALHRSATAMGAADASAQALLLLRDLFGRDLPPGMAEALARPRQVRLLVAGAYKMMAPRDASRETGDWWRGQLLSLAMQPLLTRGLRHKRQVLRGVLYLPSAMYGSPLPPSLYAFYPLIRIPAWALRRARFALGRVSKRGKSATTTAETS